MKVIKVFISQPMNGRPFEEVMDERRAMMDEFKKWAISAKLIDEDTTVIDVNMSFADAEEGKGRIWYLGRSIQTMETADFVVFHKAFLNAAGCCVEHMAANKYFENMVDITDPSSRIPPAWANATMIAPGKITSMIDEVFFNRIY